MNTDSPLVIDAHGHAWMCSWTDAGVQGSEFTDALSVLPFEGAQKQPNPVAISTP